MTDTTGSLALFLFLPAIILILGLAAYALYHWITYRRNSKIARQEYQIERHPDNPIISPLPHREWETHGTFNPAAIEDDEGSVHLLYRAIGDNGLSNIGYAGSLDGLNFTKRSSFPIYQPGEEEKFVQSKNVEKKYNPAMYTSGGGWGGHEDPRAVRIGDRVYMTYTAFQGWESVRIALTSIAMDDLKKERWNWKKPRLISPPGEVHKNWVLFPEKIGGKYAILHGISPDILIDYVDDLDHPSHPDRHIRSKAPKGGRPEYWDNWMRGAGPPPLRTKLGWLLLYHAMDHADPNKYKLGALILDIADPTRILYRSSSPLLTPEMCYENDGKPGVVYASGALIRNGKLFVYYGGGDKHVCVAQTELEPLLEWLETQGKV